ncbi:BTAD domain-containing putative transcriptional regulator [Streptomyces sp. AK02-01A]|uniref:BTAD domain-containing putative transcriptional regulator n=1 Tax=Streptomyces sp. AK02-01A TaxID=3028648 RepID=UPI0029A81D56|nr:BTAD domain-containing putative transcriptional regulator [Streptomyces sp. AK02-01A]MDX3853677.1 BTAD domain-containing putative transcriptional regulator [Streptomyces sp. AK02-01A]
MEFRILGPLEVSFRDQAVPLGGFKQRAALGLLLLRANRVVATSEMLGALWPEEDLPATARKIVQNAVWGLRAILSEPPDDRDRGAVPVERPELLTQAPGYILRVDPDRLDVNRFDRQVAEGRARLVAGDTERAARLLREALAEWRGPALADLAEHGVAWPELTALRQLRLDVMEDRFEAELSCGRHQGVLGELVSLVAAEPLRERLCGQLMLALYRCGRQAEALSVFTRVRRALVEEYGLEPSRDLQLLQQSILTHDPSLVAPVEAGPEELVLATVRPLRGGPPPRAEEPPRRDARVGEDHRPEEQRHVSGPEHRRDGACPHQSQERRVRQEEQARREPRPTAPQAATGRADAGGSMAGPLVERRQVSVVLVRTGFTGEADALAADHIALSLHDAVSAFSEGVEEFGGTVVGSLGYVSVGLFGLREDRPTASLDAVAAALAVRDRLNRMPGPTFHAVVVAGSALVRHDPGDPAAPVTVVGRLLDDAQTLLTAVPPGEVYVSGDAARVSEVRSRHWPVVHLEADHEVPRQRTPGETYDAPAGAHHDPADREHELAILTNLLDRSRSHESPHLVTILGEQGVGKTRFLEEFERRVSLRSAQVRVVRVAAEGDFDNGPQLARDILAACCGLPAGAGADHRFAEAVRRLAGHGPTAERLVYSLHPLMGPASKPPSHDEIHESWIELVTLAARERPLVLCFDDIHRSEDSVLDCVERLVSTARSAPLFVVASARPELLERRPFWGSGQRHTGTLTLDRLPEPGVDLLSRFAGRTGPAEGPAYPAGSARNGARWGRALGGHEAFLARHAER